LHPDAFYRRILDALTGSNGAGRFFLPLRSCGAVSLRREKSLRLFTPPAKTSAQTLLAPRDATVDAMYLRIIVHANEHMGQLVAYARMTGVVPPWSKN